MKAVISKRNILNGVIGLLTVVSVGWASPGGLHILIDGLSPYYSPYLASVDMGNSVVWTNPTPSPHTVTHDGCRDSGPCMFDSGSILPGGSYQLPVLPPGRYPYHCTLHPIMRGILVIQEHQMPAST